MKTKFGMQLGERLKSRKPLRLPGKVSTLKWSTKSKFGLKRCTQLGIPMETYMIILQGQDELKKMYPEKFICWG
jgi:hypothetical protein